MLYSFFANMRRTHHQKSSAKGNGGFTLLEMIVALGVFITALVVATSTLLAVVNADRKSRSARVAIDNLNLTLEDMSRKIKTGYTYSCGGGLTVLDCAVAQTVFAFTDQTGTRILYKRGIGPNAITTGALASGCGAEYITAQGCILRSNDAGVSFLPITSTEIDVTTLNFFVVGSAPSPDTRQPAVVITLDGSEGAGSAAAVAFKIQTTIIQRAYDY